MIAYASAAYNTVFPAVSDIMDIQGIFHVAQTLLENHMHRSAFYTYRRHTSYMMQLFGNPVPELLQISRCICKTGKEEGTVTFAA